MSVVAIVNRKGGSGKSTVATHLAGHLARRGVPVMLGDLDRQQSSTAWLRRRAQHARVAPILGWTVDPMHVLRPPAGVTQLILDTPGGLPELELNRLLLSTDALLIPVCDSTFDRESAAAFLATLRAHPRVATGRVRIAALGMRIDSRTHAAAALRQWAAGLEVPFVGALRATQGYVRCIEQGLTLFDLPAARVQTDLDQWQPVLDWLQPILDAAPAPRPTLPARHAVNPTPRLVPVQAAGAPMREPAAQRVHAVAPSPGKPSLPRVQALAPQRLGALASMRRLLGWA